jgi:hypothetical protein
LIVLSERLAFSDVIFTGLVYLIAIRHLRGRLNVEALKYLDFLVLLGAVDVLL